MAKGKENRFIRDASKTFENYGLKYDSEYEAFKSAYKENLTYNEWLTRLTDDFKSSSKLKNEDKRTDFLFLLQALKKSTLSSINHFNPILISVLILLVTIVASVLTSFYLSDQNISGDISIPESVLQTIEFTKADDGHIEVEFSLPDNTTEENDTDEENQKINLFTLDGSTTSRDDESFSWRLFIIIAAPIIILLIIFGQMLIPTFKDDDMKELFYEVYIYEFEKYFGISKNRENLSREDHLKGEPKYKETLVIDKAGDTYRETVIKADSGEIAQFKHINLFSGSDAQPPK